MTAKRYSFYPIFLLQLLAIPVENPFVHRSKPLTISLVQATGR
jgi:hypothetical protein